MPKNELSRREREKERHRNDILDAALILFSEFGFHSVSMQQVADKAEFSIGTLYNYFRNKEDLYSHLLDKLTDRFHADLTGALSEGNDEIEKLRNYIIAKSLVFRENLDIVLLYFRETSGVKLNLKAGLDDRIRIQYVELLALLAGVFEDGIRKKRFHGIAEPYFLALTLDSLTNATLLGCLEDPEKRLYPQDPDVFLNVLFKGLLVS